MARPRKGTPAGDEATRKYRENLIRKYGEEGMHEFFSRIGAKGGMSSKNGGFAADPKRAILAGAIGGLRGKRAHSVDYIIRVEGKIDAIDVYDAVTKCTSHRFKLGKEGGKQVIKIYTTPRIVDNIVKRIGYFGVGATYEEVK